MIMKRKTNDIALALASTSKQIAVAEQRFKRPSGSVCLLVVSKTRSVDEIQAVINAGQRCLAENYFQEATKKILQIDNKQIEWHFIGAIQSNKVRGIAQHFHWVHSVDSRKVLYRLNELCATKQPPMNVCLQVNISKEMSKGGMDVDSVKETVADCSSLSNIRLRGLMALPAPTSDFAQQRSAFAELKRLFIALQADCSSLDTLSMGTSNDFVAAIAEGATMVRIGNSIFGAQNKQ